MRSLCVSIHLGINPTGIAKWPSTFPNDPIKRIRVTLGHANKCLRHFRMDNQDYYVIGISGVVGNCDGNCYSLIFNLMLHNSPQINVRLMAHPERCWEKKCVLNDLKSK